MSHSSPAKRKVLIPQARIEVAHAPYLALAEKYGFMIDFKPFTSIVSVPVSAFRKYKQDIVHKKAAILFTNKVAIDRFFGLIDDIKVKMSDDVRYFCATEQLKNYLQKYIQIKQRKMVCGQRGIEDIFGKIKKHKDLNFLFPSSNKRKKSLYDFFKDNGLSYKEVPTYETKVNDLSDLSHDTYHLILFFSPVEVKAMAEHFPDFLPGKTTRVAIFGKLTADALKDVGWKADIEAPSMGAPSLVDAIDMHFRGDLMEELPV